MKSFIFNIKEYIPFLKKHALLLLILTAISPVNSIEAAARAQEWHTDEATGIRFLYLTYNRNQQRFLGWTDEAKYFWENGTLPQSRYTSPVTKLALADIEDELADLRREIRQRDQRLEQQSQTIGQLTDIIENLNGQILQIKTLALTRVWHDVNDQSFIGTLVSYELGEAKIKRTSDGRVYNIPLSKLSAESKAMILALSE
ncbi:hypothetical protein ACWPKS_09880 [Coraliomargarita sp. W4R72]